jgi:sugar transferase (PEP-CTERM/EpsH1 system associated)
LNAERPLIVHVVYRFGVGGLENGVVNLLNGLPASRWRHAVLSLTDISSSFAGRIRRDDVRFIELGKGPGHLARYYPRLHRLFRELRPAVVHTRNLAALEAVVPAWSAGVPVRIHGEHGWDMHDPEGRRRRFRYVRRAYRPFVSHYVALSRQLESYLRERIHVSPARISQTYNGVDTARFAPGEARAAIPGCPFDAPGQWLVGWAGRMEEVKDPLNLARAFVRATQRSTQAARSLRLVLVGDGGLREAMRGYFERHRVLNRVWFAGERADMPEIMRGLDCFVLPSLGEGVSNTILEAMATRLPVVATRVGGNAELIESGLSGLIVPPANSEALAEAMLEYFNDPGMARRHAKAARHAAVTRFSLHRMLRDYSNLYERSLGAAGVPLPPAGEALAPR